MKSNVFAGAQWLGMGMALICSLQVHASPLTTRSELNAILGVNQMVENFETPTIASQTRYTGGSFNSSVNFAGLGTNLVVAGVTFQRNTSVVGVGAPGYRGIDWNPTGYYGATSQRLSGAGGGGSSVSTRNDFQFIFDAPVTAFGVDLTAYEGFASNGQASVYDRAGALLATVNVTGSVAGTFFGWENAAGIGQVFFHNNPLGNYIQFDNLGFGAAPVPLPASIWMFATAFVGWLTARRGSRV